MDGIIKIEKTYEQRLQEYRDIFAGNGVFSLPRIRKEFSMYLEMQVEPKGWEAIWKVPKFTCEYFQLDFPTILLVFVEHIDWSNLIATVKIVAVLDDIHLPEIHQVPVIQLWPLKKQDNPNIIEICNALDVVRFFHMNLYMPWDEAEDDTIDWVEHHLESRLQIFYDLKSGVFPHNMAKHVRSLLTTAQHLQEEMQSVVCEDELMELQVSLLEIQKEVELLENCLARKVLIKRAKCPVADVKQWFICDEGLLEDYLRLLTEGKRANEKVILAPNLSDAWDAGMSGNHFILQRGAHYIDTVGILEEGGSLIGTQTDITSSNRVVMFDFSADVLLENLTIKCSSQSAIVVRRGTLTIKNCKIVQDLNTNDSSQGVVVLNGASLELINCVFAGFTFAVTANRNSFISVKNCEIIDADYGLKLYDDCVVEMENSKINSCRQYGVWVEAKAPGGQQLIAGFPVLEKYISFDNVLDSVINYYL